MLSDEFWSKLEKILLQEAIYNKRDLRMTAEGMLHRVWVSCRRETYPKRSAAGISSTMVKDFQGVGYYPDWEWEFIDDSYIKSAPALCRGIGQGTPGDREKPCRQIPQRFIWQSIVWLDNCV